MRKALARFVMSTTLLRMAFCRNIVVGSVYYLDDESRKNPFKKRIKVSVLNVKDGYVSFEHDIGGFNSSLKITPFLCSYSLII